MASVRILLAEDNYDNLELMRLLLERGGYEVLSVHNGRSCVQLALQEKPDLILMDLSMPEMDGWEAARQLKAEAATRAIPLVAVTAHTLPGDRKRAFDAGFDEYLSKPINVPLFDKIIADTLARKKK